MTSFSSKLNRMRSVKLSFTNNKKREQQQQQEEDSRYRTPEQYHYQQQKQQQRPFGTNNNNYVETLRVLSTEAKQTQYNDVFDSFFFNDKRCQNRAFFMAGRLKANLDYHPSSSTAMRASSSFGNLPLTNPPTTPATLMNIRPSPSQSTPVPNNTSFQASNDYTKSATPTAASAASAAANTKNQSYVDSFWRMITHRLYTLNYILFVLPPDSETRIAFLNRLESDLNKVGDGQELYRRGGMEAHFAVRYALEHKHGYNKLRRRKTLLEDAFELERRQKKMNGEAVTVGDVCGVERSVNPDHERLCEQARLIIEQCLESESRLAHQEKDAMYVFHGMRAGLMGAFEPHVELEEDRDLRHLLKDVVHQNKKPPYENPFEDEDCIVREEEEDDDYDEDDKREVDSGFYDNCSSSV